MFSGFGLISIPIANAASFRQCAIGSITIVLPHSAIDCDLTDIYLNDNLRDYNFYNFPLPNYLEWTYRIGNAAGAVSSLSLQRIKKSVLLSKDIWHKHKSGIKKDFPCPIAQMPLIHSICSEFIWLLIRLLFTKQSLLCEFPSALKTTNQRLVLQHILFSGAKRKWQIHNVIPVFIMTMNHLFVLCLDWIPA